MVRIKNKFRSIVVGVILLDCLSMVLYSNDNCRMGVFERSYNYFSKLVTEKMDIEEDRIMVILYPSFAEGMANKWFNRGNVEIAVEFYRLYLRQASTFAEEIADKFFEEGHIEIALEFDKLYLKEKPEHALFLGTERHIADKWFRRGNVDFAMELDWLSLEKFPNFAIGDKWFKRGEVGFALECDEVCLKKSPGMAVDVADKWVERGDLEVAHNFAVCGCMADSALALKVLEHWIHKERFDLAEVFSNRVLASWVAEDGVNVNKGLMRKLQFAARVNSRFYYDQLKNRAFDELTFIKDTYQEEVYDYGRVLKTVALTDRVSYFSYTDYLINKFYIDPEILDRNRATREEFCDVIKSSLNHLSKKGDITFSILHIIALHAKKDPYFRVNVLVNYPTRDTVLGLYLPSLKRVQIVCNPFEDLEAFESTLAHEWGHQLMNILYDNKSKPYLEENGKARGEYLRVIEVVQKCVNDIDLASVKGNAMRAVIRIFKHLFDVYEQSKYEEEMIVKLPEIIARGYYEDFEVQELLKPLKDYWMKYIAKDIERYIREEAGIDDFSK